VEPSERHLERDVIAAVGQGQYLRALALADQLVEERPDEPIPRCWRAYALAHLEHWEEAWQEAQTAAAAGPANEAAYLVKARIASQTGRQRPAREAYQRALELSTSHTEVLTEYAVFMAMEMPPNQAEPICSLAAKETPNSPTAHAALGLALYRQRVYKLAEGHLKRALELDANCPMARVAMAMLLEDTGRSNQARALASLLTEDPRTNAYAGLLQKRAMETDVLRRALDRLSEVRLRQQRQDESHRTRLRRSIPRAVSLALLTAGGICLGAGLGSSNGGLAVVGVAMLAPACVIRWSLRHKA
jgi:Tfp pilus assembly protein PilF